MVEWNIPEKVLCWKGTTSVTCYPKLPLSPFDWISEDFWLPFKKKNLEHQGWTDSRGKRTKEIAIVRGSFLHKLYSLSLLVTRELSIGNRVPCSHVERKLCYLNNDCFFVMKDLTQPFYHSGVFVIPWGSSTCWCYQEHLVAFLSLKCLKTFSSSWKLNSVVT